MSLYVYDRPQRGGALYIKGTVDFRDGTPPVKVYHRAASDQLANARQQAVLEEASIIREHFLGGQRGPDWTLAQGIHAYVTAAARSASTQRRLKNILMTVDGDTTKLKDVNQLTVNLFKTAMPLHAEQTIEREITVPLRAVLKFCAGQGMIQSVPVFTTPKYIPDPPTFFLPQEATLLVASAAPHLQPLVTFLFGTGARMSEALYLDWADVKLLNYRVIFQANRTKAQKRRDVVLPPCVVRALVPMPRRQGPVFLTQDGRAYTPRDDQGGQIATAWETAIKRAGLRPELTPHSCRHTYATWHYAMHKDVLKLKQDGGWSSVALVERYAHLIDDSHKDEILKFLGMTPRAGSSPASPADIRTIEAA